MMKMEMELKRVMLFVAVMSLVMSRTCFVEGEFDVSAMIFMGDSLAGAGNNNMLTTSARANSSPMALPSFLILRGALRMAGPSLISSALKADENDDDDLDFFGEETEEEKKAAEEREAAKKASTKKKESDKSLVVLKVKHWDEETDMKKMEEVVRGVQMPGLL